MRGILYLECRYAVHQAAAILRSPLRLALWIPYVLTLVLLVSWRTFAQAHGRASLGALFADRSAEVVAGLYVGALGTTIAMASSGRVFAFRNAAEAVLFSNAGIRPLEIALWLQVRKLVTSGARWLTGVTYIFVIFAPRHAGVLANARLLGIALLAVALQMSLDLPAFLLARGRLKAPVQAFGYLLAALGFAFGALSLFAPALEDALVKTVRVDPGAALGALLRGDTFGVIILTALLGALVAAVALLGGDALPELYAASQQPVAMRRPERRGAAHERFRPPPTNAGRRIPPGALTLVWKDWAGFRRRRGSLRIYLAICAFSAIVGAGAVIAAKLRNDPTSSAFASLGSVFAIALLVAAPFGASLAIASDLSKPIFWLSRAPLRARVGAWTFARTWRGAIAIGMAPLLAGIVARNITLAAAALPLAFAIFWSLQSLGVGLFAMFPNPIDSRGPMLLVRTLLTVAYATPPIFLAVVTFALVRGSHAGAIFAALACAGAFALEGWIVVELASRRFAERGASLSTLSRSG